MLGGRIPPANTVEGCNLPLAPKTFTHGKFPVRRGVPIAEDIELRPAKALGRHLFKSRAGREASRQGAQGRG